jgi:hypothetical protein
MSPQMSVRCHLDLIGTARLQRCDCILHAFCRDADGAALQSDGIAYTEDIPITIPFYTLGVLECIAIALSARYCCELRAGSSIQLANDDTGDQQGLLD